MPALTSTPVLIAAAITLGILVGFCTCNGSRARYRGDGAHLSDLWRSRLLV